MTAKKQQLVLFMNSRMLVESTVRFFQIVGRAASLFVSFLEVAETVTAERASTVRLLIIVDSKRS